MAGTAWPATTPRSSPGYCGPAIAALPGGRLRTTRAADRKSVV